jgi:hypothetical protein
MIKDLGVCILGLEYGVKGFRFGGKKSAKFRVLNSRLKVRGLEIRIYVLRDRV